MSGKPVVELKDMETMFVSIVDFGANGRKFLTVKRSGSEKRRLTRAEINNLPDAAFAFIEPGGKKDATGKTTPRELRHLPHHEMSVKSPNEHVSIDLPRLRNALSRVQQTKISAEGRTKALNHLRAHARALGVGKKEFDVMLDAATGEVIVEVDKETQGVTPEANEIEKGADAEVSSAPVTPSQDEQVDDRVPEGFVSKDVHEKAVGLLTARNEWHETCWAAKAASKAIQLRDDETVRDMQNALRRAIEPVGKQVLGNVEHGWFSIKDVVDGAAILSVVTDDLKSYQVPFSRDSKGAFTFGEPEEVVARTVYEPADTTKQAAKALRVLGDLQKGLAEKSASLKEKVNTEKAEQEAQAKKAAEAVKQLRGGAELNGDSGAPPSSPSGGDFHWPEDMNEGAA